MRGGHKRRPLPGAVEQIDLHSGETETPHSAYGGSSSSAPRPSARRCPASLPNWPRCTQHADGALAGPQSHYRPVPELVTANLCVLHIALSTGQCPIPPSLQVFPCRYDNQTSQERSRRSDSERNRRRERLAIYEHLRTKERQDSTSQPRGNRQARARRAVFRLATIANTPTAATRSAAESPKAPGRSDAAPPATNSATGEPTHVHAVAYAHYLRQQLARPPRQRGLSPRPVFPEQPENAYARSGITTREVVTPTWSIVS